MEDARPMVGLSSRFPRQVIFCVLSDERCRTRVLEFLVRRLREKAFLVTRLGGIVAGI